MRLNIFFICLRAMYISFYVNCSNYLPIYPHLFIGLSEGFFFLLLLLLFLFIHFSLRQNESEVPAIMREYI